MRNFLKYNSFNLSHDNKFTCDMGMLIPADVQEVLPGDVWRGNANMFIRLIPQLAPFMHTVKAYTHFFFVPARLVQVDFEKFITKGFSGNEVVPWTYITAPSGGFAKYTPADYMGLPVGIAGITVDAKPFRAYNFICNEWYLNENLQTYIQYSTGNGADTTTPNTLVARNWMSDYFTSALPFAQRGDPVYLPLGTTAPVIGTGKALGLMNNLNSVHGMMVNANSSSILGFSNGTSLDSTLPDIGSSFTSGGSDGQYKVIGLSTNPKNSGVVADLSTAGAVPINDVRVATRVQRWMEKNARGGVRYIEFLLSHFGVKSSDGRLDRPEYLGGGKSVIVTSEVLQTSSTDSTSPQGNMSGHSFTASRSNGFERRFEEHGYLFCIVSIMPRTQYQQGIAKMWKRQTPLDYYFPEFADLGAQPIYNYELYADGTSADNGVFGFKDPYDELRKSYSHVSADFRDSLDYWTMTRKFTSRPQLNADFVSASDVTKRIFSVTNAKPCLVDIGFNYQVLRKLPKKGIFGLL